MIFKVCGVFGAVVAIAYGIFAGNCDANNYHQEKESK